MAAARAAGALYIIIQHFLVRAPAIATRVASFPSILQFRQALSRVLPPPGGRGGGGQRRRRPSFFLRFASALSCSSVIVCGCLYAGAQPLCLCAGTGGAASAELESETALARNRHGPRGRSGGTGQVRAVGAVGSNGSGRWVHAPRRPWRRVAPPCAPWPQRPPWRPARRMKNVE